MSTVTGHIRIQRPVEEVFDFVADERNEPTYNAEMSSVEQVTDGPVGVGTVWRATLVQRRRPVDLAIEVTEHERPSRLGTHTVLTGMDIDGVLEFRPAGDGTEMSWDWRLRPHGTMRLLGPFIGVAGRRQEERIWTSLRDVLESDD